MDKEGIFSSSSNFLTKEFASNVIELPKAFEGINSITSPSLNTLVESEKSVMLINFLFLSTPKINLFPFSFELIDRTLEIMGSASLPPSISIMVDSLPWISNPWFPFLAFTPRSLTFASCEIIFGIEDSSCPHKTTFIDLPSLPFILILSAFPGWPLEFVNSILVIIPSIKPDIARSFWPSFTSLTSFVILSIFGISLSFWSVSKFDPEPILIVGSPLRSDFTYALIIFTRSPGLMFSIPGRFAFSSHNFTLAVELLS